MSESILELSEQMEKSTSKRPRIQRKTRIPDQRTSRVADGEDIKAAEKQIEDLIVEKQKVPVSKKCEIPDQRTSRVADGEDIRAAEKQIEDLIVEKQKVPVSKKCEIPDSDRSSDLPNYPQDNANKGNDTGKNMEFANLLVKSFSFGRIIKTLYIQRDGIFAPLLEVDFDLLLRMAALRDDLPENLQKSISSYKSSELYAWLLAHPAVKELPEMPDKHYVAVLNGILDLKKKKLLQLEDFSGDKVVPILFNRINANYIDYTNADWLASNTCRYLNRLAHPDCREKCVNALLYLNGKICSNDRSGKNLYNLWGPSNNGKSVLAAYLQAILGPGNFGNLSLKDLVLQFSMINLRHALVNISTDEDTDAWNSSIASLIKRITGHDTLQVDVKYERMQQFRPYCILLCMGNAEPKYSKELDAGGAISKRLFLIPTGPTVDDPDEDLLEKKLLPEKDLFFSVAIDYFMNHDHPDKIIDVEDIVSPEISPKDLFQLWVGDCVEVTDSSDEILTSDLWDNYCKYVRDMPGASRMKRRSFEMECAVRLSGNKSQSRWHNHSAYIGLRLKDKVYSPNNPNTDFGGW